MDEGIIGSFVAYHAPRNFAEIKDLQCPHEATLGNDRGGLGQSVETSFLGFEETYSGGLIVVKYTNITTGNACNATNTTWCYDSLSVFTL
jgi:hypothetical protein